MFDKLRYALSLFDGTELLICFIFLIVYHLIIMAIISLSAKTSMSIRLRTLEKERDEFRRNWESRDLAWKDREDELRRMLAAEKEREVSQLKAEYDSYLGLLEQKLMRPKSRQQGIS